MRRPGLCVVEVSGEVDLLTAPLLGRRLSEALHEAPVDLVINLEAVSFLASMGLGALLDARALAVTVGTTLHLAGSANPTVGRVLEMTGVIAVFPTYRSLADACAACAGGDGAIHT